MPGPAPTRTVPILPCPDLEEALAFYGALGFQATFVQRRPYPCAVVARDDWEVHLSGIDGFVPEHSYASCIVVVADPGALHAEFAAGVKAAHGRVPLAGIPRLLRPRRKQGTVSGFSLVDVGGNWLRFYRAGGVEGEDDADVSGLRRVLLGAARQGDARGDDARAEGLLDKGLARHPDAPVDEWVEAMVYLAELRLRLGNLAAARILVDDVAALPLDDEERAGLSTLLEAADEVRAQLPG